MALAILSGMSGAEFSQCVQNNDTAALVRLPGIGKKTAERLIVEMRDRLGKLDGIETAAAVATGAATSDVSPATTTPISDAIGALIALGYKPNDASKMVRMINCEGLASEEIIRLALQGVAAKS